MDSFRNLRGLSSRSSTRLTALGVFVIGVAACSDPDAGTTSATGGIPGTGGAGASAGVSTGGASAGSTGAGTGGSTATGGVATGGTTATTGGSPAMGGGAGLGLGGGGTDFGGGAGTAGMAGDAGMSGMASGGVSGNAGAAGSPTGGVSGSAGAGGSGKAGAGGAGSVTCTITPTVMPATSMPLVGVATFTTDLAGADRAVIQFGKTTTYGLEAPVNWAAASHRTLILGMPANTDVHYRVVVYQGNNACTGPDATFRTGANVSGAPGNITPTKGTSTAMPAPGFIIAERERFAYIINNVGEVVWAHQFPVSLSRAIMSFDGMYMYGRDTGPFNAASGGNIYRVSMDGSGETKLNVSGGHHHDVVATPTGIAYPGKQAAGACDCIFVANADGSNSRCLVDLDIVFGKFANGPGTAATEKCHVNAIRYYKDTDTFSVSDREKDAIAFISSTGQVLGSVGATPTGTTPNHAKAQGADSTTSSVWRVQHGHDWYAPNKLVLWSNGSFQGGTSKVLHYTISGATATLDWQYAATGNSPTLSDAQHLSNGNFLATASQTGAVHEFDAQQRLVQSFANLSRGYTCQRPTLYGPPPGR